MFSAVSMDSLKDGPTSITISTFFSVVNRGMNLRNEFSLLYFTTGAKNKRFTPKWTELSRKLTF